MHVAQSSKHMIYTIGHSTRSIDDFIRILKEFAIQKVIDIRTIPKSRHNPQFNSDYLKTELHKHKIGYVHIKALGGLRHAHANSINTGWHNSSFRGFADYMQTAAFESGIEKLVTIAQKKTVVIMCAEALPWHCHRSLIADALLVRDFTVEDIYNQNTAKMHRLTEFATVHGKHITYPAPDTSY
jgi:uncharacterized protein (DUF488 family)